MCSVHSTNGITVYKWVPGYICIFYVPVVAAVVANGKGLSWTQFVGTVEVSTLEVHVSQASP